MEKLSFSATSSCVLRLERLGCNAMPSEIAAFCGTTEERILELKRGIHGILIDARLRAILDTLILCMELAEAVCNFVQLVDAAGLSMSNVRNALQSNPPALQVS